MQFVADLVAAYRVHIGVESFAGFEAVFVKGEALPFRKGVHDFRYNARLLYVEVHRSFHAVEVIVQSAVAGDEKRRRNAREIEIAREQSFEIVFDEFDLYFRFEQRRHHSNSNLFTFFGTGQG